MRYAQLPTDNCQLTTLRSPLISPLLPVSPSPLLPFLTTANSLTTLRSPLISPLLPFSPSPHPQQTGNSKLSAVRSIPSIPPSLHPPVSLSHNCQLPTDNCQLTTHNSPLNSPRLPFSNSNISCLSFDIESLR